MSGSGRICAANASMTITRIAYLARTAQRGRVRATSGWQLHRPHARLADVVQDKDGDAVGMDDLRRNRAANVSSDATVHYKVNALQQQRDSPLPARTLT